jgi:hypothetical protein
MDINAIDEQWEKMEDTDFYRGLSIEEQDEQREFFKQKMLGELDYTTLHEYKITGPNGYEMTVYSKDSTEADRKAASLGKDYVVENTGKVKFQMTSTLTDTTNTTKAGTVSNKPVGTIYVDSDDKQVYKVGAGGKLEVMSMANISDPWSADAIKMLSLGRTNNPIYDELINTQADSIISGEHKITGKITNAELLSNLKSRKVQTNDVSEAYPYYNPPAKNSIIEITKDDKSATFIVINPVSTDNGTTIQVMDLDTGIYYDLNPGNDGHIAFRKLGGGLIDSPLSDKKIFSS